MLYCIETQHLTYHYQKGNTLLHGLNLQVPSQAIYGFLGANGAGKTTTLKLLTSLLQNQSGSITVLNQPLPPNRLQLMQQVGVFIESPSIYSHLSATENLEVFRRLYQCPVGNIAEALETVGLQNTGNKKAGRFSLGMKQRLGIAVALLHKPSLLILDEPTNGLDPQGMIEMRTLLKKLNHEQHISILISSHMLAEMEKLVTHIGIIDKGRLLYQGTLASLTTTHTTKGTPATLETTYMNLINPVIV
ncbi:ABC-2 type transport system ATP-binding protein [Filimonas lacunae]|uniref:ABC-2 type transport system ATP-binding protein n=1 Tax=Filimonas lacunae TaxID=477680 RepID=A0A173MQE2_9BACT|nr:ATP-binding cassette domain-containing protein [Filimonas lacunae]BAV09707.1 bacitracin ABC transporter, ATP-binding protein [Filimonas lacunae]SIS77588.1 ABC-2 type transport system ATP-binding protein [Filimonas lacunae]